MLVEGVYMYESTISIEFSIKENLTILSNVSGKSVCLLVKELIKKAILSSHIVVQKSLTEYQVSDSRLNYVRFRYRFNEQERLLFFQARVDFCMSVSKLLLVGYILYYEKLLKKFTKQKVKHSYTIILKILANSVEKYINNSVIIKKME